MALTSLQLDYIMELDYSIASVEADFKYHNRVLNSLIVTPHKYSPLARFALYNHHCAALCRLSKRLNWHSQVMRVV